MIDSHCHLHYDYAPKSEIDLIQEAKAAGITALITVGTDMVALPKIQEISAKYPDVYHTVGVHPHDVSGMKDEDLKTLEEASKHPKCRAIGEIGLDYYYKHSDPAIQIKRLDDQLNLASRVGLPVVIHSRDAEKDLLASLTHYAKQLSSERIPGVIHCFTGTQDFGEACLDLGFYISFSGILTFKNADDLRASAKAFPLDRLLVETDSPYLAPVPFRGKKCEPSMVKYTAQKLAEVKGLPLDKIVQATSANTRKVFRLP